MCGRDEDGERFVGGDAGVCDGLVMGDTGPPRMIVGAEEDVRTREPLGPGVPERPLKLYDDGVRPGVVAGVLPPGLTRLRSLATGDRVSSSSTNADATTRRRRCSDSGRGEYPLLPDLLRVRK